MANGFSFLPPQPSAALDPLFGGTANPFSFLTPGAPGGSVTGGFSFFGQPGGVGGGLLGAGGLFSPNVTTRRNLGEFGAFLQDPRLRGGQFAFRGGGGMSLLDVLSQEVLNPGGGGGFSFLPRQATTPGILRIPTRGRPGGILSLPR